MCSPIWIFPKSSPPGSISGYIMGFIIVIIPPTTQIISEDSIQLLGPFDQLKSLGAFVEDNGITYRIILKSFGV